MKNLFLTVYIFVAFISSTLAGTNFIITTSLDSKNMPSDKLTEIPFDKDHEYLMFVYKDDNSAWGVEKVYFEISIYNEDKDKYVYEDLYTVDTKTDWGFCYKGVKFNTTGKIKIRVFTNDDELVTKYISVVN